MKIGVLAAADSWHFRDLTRAAGSQHQIISLSFDDLSTSFGVGSPTFNSQTIDLESLDRLIVRTMPAGSLQRIIFRMDLLRQLDAAGVTVINPPRSIEIAVDKYLSLSMLSDAGVAVPPTAVAETLKSAMDCFDSLGGDVVYKPIFGSMGRGIERLTDREEAKKFFAEQIESGQVIYLQKFIDHGDWDVRVLVVGERVFAIKRDREGHWLTNMAQGATGSPHNATAEEIAIANRAMQVSGCLIGGVDLFYEHATGKPLVCEVNASPGWKATAETLNVDIANAILDAVCAADLN